MAWPVYRSPSGHYASLMPLGTLLAILGTADTSRNLKKKWGLYHAGVMLMLYADLMVVTLLAFLSLFRFFTDSTLPEQLRTRPPTFPAFIVRIVVVRKS